MTLLGDKQIETFPGSSFNGRSAHTPGLETASGADVVDCFNLGDVGPDATLLERFSHGEHLGTYAVSVCGLERRRVVSR